MHVISLFFCFVVVPCIRRKEGKAVSAFSTFPATTCIHAYFHFRQLLFSLLSPRSCLLHLRWDFEGAEILNEWIHLRKEKGGRESFAVTVVGNWNDGCGNCYSGQGCEWMEQDAVGRCSKMHIAGSASHNCIVAITIFLTPSTIPFGN